MRRHIAILGIGLLLAAGPAQQAVFEKQEHAFPQLRQGKRRKNKTANKINVFMGYASDRKGKGQKKRDASNRQKNGWR